MGKVAESQTSDLIKAKQVDYYDHGIADKEFEINRPHLQSLLYKYVMDVKFGKVMDLLGHGIQGRTVLAICCGSGMDAEYLAGAGARVVALDLSMGCLSRARTRAQRFACHYELVQGDVEALPFADNSFDYAFVHDGLHHLVEQETAIREMARIARVGLLISEPAKAAVTSIPTSLRLMSPAEEAGNKVNRVDPKQLSLLLSSLGFDRLRSHRFLMHYGHPPGRWWSLLDSQPLQVLARLGVQLGASHLAPWGNKLVVVAERSGAARY